jgi:antibiotic biosynthesis monooxygenase (ABM) superfamily enzyme
VHVRAVVTWLAIFPMVAIGMSVIGAVAPTWPAVMKALVLTLVVVPTAVYALVPRFLLLYARIRTR